MLGGDEFGVLDLRDRHGRCVTHHEEELGAHGAHGAHGARVERTHLVVQLALTGQPVEHHATGPDAASARHDECRIGAKANVRDDHKSRPRRCACIAVIGAAVHRHRPDKGGQLEVRMVSEVLLAHVDAEIRGQLLVLCSVTNKLCCSLRRGTHEEAENQAAGGFAQVRGCVHRRARGVRGVRHRKGQRRFGNVADFCKNDADPRESCKPAGKVAHTRDEGHH